jgi:hypothetical protein
LCIGATIDQTFGFIQRSGDLSIAAGRRKLLVLLSVAKWVVCSFYYLKLAPLYLSAVWSNQMAKLTVSPLNPSKTHVQRQLTLPTTLGAGWL